MLSYEIEKTAAYFSPADSRLKGYTGHDKLMAALREQLSEAEIEKLAAQGAAWSEDQAVEEALKA
jgi:hypothetical protein